MKIWSTLKHRNILPLLGYFVEGGEYPNFISMWMENGSLFEYMEDISGGVESLYIVSVNLCSPEHDIICVLNTLN